MNGSTPRKNGIDATRRLAMSGELGSRPADQEVTMFRLQLLRKTPVRRRQFRLDAPAARSVTVTGDFCDWDPVGRPLRCDKSGVWKVFIALAPGRYEYRYLVDGRWADDPACTEHVANPFGSWNCVLHIGETAGKPKRSLLTHKELDGYRKALLDLSVRLDRNLAHDQRELMREEDPNMPGGPLPSTEDEQDDGLHEREVGLIAHEATLLAEVTAALRRIDTGTYGRCATCLKRIARSRLDALPYARQCIRCARSAPPVGG